MRSGSLATNHARRPEVLVTVNPPSGLDQEIPLFHKMTSSERRFQIEDASVAISIATPTLHCFRYCAHGRNLNYLVDTPLARLRFEGTRLDYLETVFDSRTARSAAKHFGAPQHRLSLATSSSKLGQAGPAHTPCRYYPRQRHAPARIAEGFT